MPVGNRGVESSNLSIDRIAFHSVAGLTNPALSAVAAVRRGLGLRKQRRWRQWNWKRYAPSFGRRPDNRSTVPLADKSLDDLSTAACGGNDIRESGSVVGGAAPPMIPAGHLDASHP